MEGEIRRHGPRLGHAWILRGFERNPLTSFYFKVWAILKKDKKRAVQQSDLGVQVPSLHLLAVCELGQVTEFV